MSHSLCSCHLSISLRSKKKKLGVKMKEGRLLVGWLVCRLGPCWQVVIGVIYHLWKGLRAHHTNHTSARCYSRGTAPHIHTHTHTYTHIENINQTQTNNLTLKHMQKEAHCYSQWNNMYDRCMRKKNQMYYGFAFRKEDTEIEEKTDQFLIQADHDWTTGNRKECF